jgi:PBSX family phage terminase large subunit
VKLKRFGAKAHAFLMRHPAHDKRMTLLEGSVRSSKTVAMMVKLLALCRYEVDGQRVITGKSKNTIYQNVLIDLFDLVGKDNYGYNRQTGELWLYGVLWIVIGAKDEGSEALIRGMTIGICYSDETSLMPRSFFMQLMARMSPEGARFYGTTNPDNPYHYLKAEVMDRAKELPGGLTVIHFTLDDNPNISKATRAYYEKMFTGVFYLRYILGLWVVAEGAIYREAWAKATRYTAADRHPGLRNAGGHARRTITIDYGTHNPTVFLDVYDTFTGKIKVDREYYYDSQKAMHEKTDSEYADDLEAFARGTGEWEGQGSAEYFDIVLDPSAASFAAELRKRGYVVIDADNEVLDGIRMTASAISSGLIEIAAECVNGDREMQTYAWNAKKAKQGEEAPIKTHDHWPDALRYYVKTLVPEWRLAA